MNVVDIYILYVSIGTVFGILHLYALRKLGEKIKGSDLLVAFATVFVWLPFLLFFVIKWIKLYRNLKKQEKEFWEKLVERALEKAEKELNSKNT